MSLPEQEVRGEVVRGLVEEDWWVVVLQVEIQGDFGNTDLKQLPICRTNYSSEETIRGTDRLPSKICDPVRGLVGTQLLSSAPTREDHTDSRRDFVREESRLSWAVWWEM
jgi:hypothetical protein